LMAIPLRRSLAASMNKGAIRYKSYIVATFSTETLKADAEFTRARRERNFVILSGAKDLT